jgi:transposase
MGRQPLMPNTENCSLEDLQIAEKAAPTRRGARRMNALRKIIEGWAHDVVADFTDITRQTLTNWIRSFNQKGIDGLVDRPRRGAPRKISEEQNQSYKDLIKHPDKAGVTHWTGVKFHGYLRNELGHELGYSTVIRWLHDQNFTLNVPQPWPDRQDEQARQKFLSFLRKWLTDEGIELWYLDECGIEGDPRPRRRWVTKGEKACIPYSGDHIRMNVAGMICPRIGEFYALEFTHMDADIFQVFLDHANSDIQTTRPRNLLICDNASWHKRKSLDWGTFEPIFLPPYSPDLNPIEKLWLLIKAEWFSDFYAKTPDQLCERIDKALCWAMDRQQKNRRTCSIKE